MANRKLGILLPTALLLASLIYLTPQAGSAAELRSGDQPSIKAEERITEDVYIAGGNVSSAGTLGADLIAAGGNVLVNGSVGGDLIAAGGSVTVLGDVADDVRAAGGNILLQGKVSGDAVVAGGQITIGGSVGGDLLAGAGTLRVDAPVSGDVRIGGGDVYLNSTVTGNVEVYAEQLTLGSGARIRGNLIYTAAKEATMEDGSAISGETTFKKRERTVSVGGIVAIISLALIATTFAQLASALLLGLVFRRYAVRLVELAAAQPLFETGRGLVVFIVLPVASMMLLWSLIGIPLGILGLLAFATTIMYLWIMTPVILGSFAYRSFFGGDFDVNWKTILLGVFIYALLGIIPIVGWLAQFILMLLTLGAAAKIKWEIAKEWR
ncbi:polymer-forming cytoskeletal protein [Candidatus Kaiserbacteria bacterium]|nr:polymer-forming cytoskeletal protein [Candidatus Kaiserbacteria bacterium]